ncbi:arginine--tRNA ligase [Blattabacterium cuenoti]|uniref:arginine--tRNA ligase n=1 Tax=Blattabacterium cuenoti TaxID=1653831 RepID=UPI00293BADD4|nr:arginine--tRNA ligase [Blattabacterium cuenoti]
MEVPIKKIFLKDLFIIMNDHFFQSIEEITKESISCLYKINPSPKLKFQYTKKNCLGDLTLILFPLSKIINKHVEKIGYEIGNYVKNRFDQSIQFSIVGGFLNFIFTNDYYIHILMNMLNPDFYKFKISSKKIMIEYSSPNANKPLHLGHLRNALLGSSLSNILEAVGHKVTKIQIINDRGIHICKSMLCWKKFGSDQTPNDVQMKGDHFVGKYYHLFENLYQNEIKHISKKDPEQKVDVPILKEARSLLKKWENRDHQTMHLWKKMNEWVYSGFEKTYKDLGICFDWTEYESDIFQIGRDIVQEGLYKKIFYQKQDGSICIDLTKDGFDEKLLLRSDQTSLYITQDIGNAVERFRKHKIDRLIYIVGKEQDYHFQVLFKILKRLGYLWVDKLHHLSYEMVSLPSGKMKSRKGNVVNADNIIVNMIKIAEKKFLKKSLIDKKKESYKILGLGALKFYFLKIDPKKEIIFDTNKSIDMKGNTGTYIQYTYSRIRSIEKKFFDVCSITHYDWFTITLNTYEKCMIKILQKYPFVLNKSYLNFNPSLLANYIYEVSKLFNHFYQNKKLINPKNVIRSNFRMNLVHITGNTIKLGMNLLGIDMIERM